MSENVTTLKKTSPMRNRDIDALFPGLDDPDVIAPYMHRGEWAVHEVLPMLVERMGPCDIRLATYMVSDESLRVLGGLKVRSLRLIVDMTVQRHKLPLLLFAENMLGDVRLDACHAKVLLMESDTKQFGIVGSANLNLAHRWESGFYFTKGKHYEYFRQQFERAYTDAIAL